ncbi:MAG: polysaccharide biosynthesis/export family protein [Geminicoccaceae bacterium]
MIRLRLLGTLLLLLGIMTACEFGGGGPPPDVTAGQPPVATPDPEAAAESVAGYRLGAGDQVRVTVFRHEDLSGEFELDGEGYFALPLVGEIKAGGKTARELENNIETAFKDGGYLVNPQVGLEVLNYRPFYILGEVNQPGSYPYVNGMTVINAVALAGGYTYRASQGNISVQRGGSNGKKFAAGPTTQVLPGDIISVPERFF